MSFFEEINALLGIADKAAGGLKRRADQWNERAEQWHERTKIEIASRNHIKTENFSSDMEKSIMLKAAEDQRQRISGLAEKLAGDPILARFYHEAWAKLKCNHDSHPELDFTSVSSVRRTEECAMKLAIDMRDEEARLNRMTPDERQRFEKALAIIESGRSKAK